MRSKKEIKKKIKELEKEKKEVPEYSMFGDPNWLVADKKVKILKKCVDLDPGEIQARLDELLDEYEGEFPDDPADKARVDAYDWVLGNTDEL